MSNTATFIPGSNPTGCMSFFILVNVFLFYLLRSINNFTSIIFHSLKTFYSTIGKEYVMAVGPDECVDVPASFDNMASSIRTYNACLVAYTENGCKGTNLTISPLTDNEDNLGIDFSDKISSGKLCEIKMGNSLIPIPGKQPSNLTTRIIHSNLLRNLLKKESRSQLL
jgi:hypothetical protein